MQTIMRLSAVKASTGLARSTIYERIRNKTFPAQIKLGARASGWLAAEIDAWVRDRISESRRDGNEGAPDSAKPRRGPR